MTILWLKALHIFFMMAWMAGLFYLPRLYVYHAATEVQAVREAYKVMERRLFWFVTPFALLTLVFGVAIMYLYGIAWLKASPWMHAKLSLLVLLYGYHGYLYKCLRVFATDSNTRKSGFYRVLNEAPVVVVLAVIVLAVVKPI